MAGVHQQEFFAGGDAVEQTFNIVVEDAFFGGVSEVDIVGGVVEIVVIVDQAVAGDVEEDLVVDFALFELLPKGKNVGLSYLLVGEGFYMDLVKPFCGLV